MEVLKLLAPKLAFCVLLSEIRLSLTDADILEKSVISGIDCSVVLSLFGAVTFETEFNPGGKETVDIGFDTLEKLLGCCSFGVGGRFR